MMAGLCRRKNLQNRMITPRRRFQAALAYCWCLRFCWLLWRFGGGGALLAKGPGDIAQKPVAPQGWALPDPGALPVGGDIFAVIRAMTDRRAAMVLLLRTSLMQAATSSGTRFARSDTEREALRRLPPTLPGRSVLGDLLREAELAHYGGREVTEDTLHRSIDRARALFAVKAAPA